MRKDDIKRIVTYCLIRQIKTSLCFFFYFNKILIIMVISQSYKQLFIGYDSFILILKYYIYFLDVWLKIKIDLLYTKN